MLIRDQASAFHECQLGLVFHRGHPFQNDLVSRLQQLFTGNFSFLSLTRQVCERAIEIAQGDQIDAPALLARARLIVAERERELSTVKFNGTVNLASRLKSLRARWLPDGSLRHRICRKIVRILRIGRSSGIRGIAARIVKRLCHPFRRTIADK